MVGLLLAALAGARPEGTRAQDPSSEGEAVPQATPPDSAASGLVWSAEIGGAYLHLESPRSPWSSQSVALSASHGPSTYRLAVRREVRFENEEWRLLADVYPQLWTGAYGHLRVAGATPGRTAAEVDGLARLYQTVGRWELSLGGRFMRFPDARTVVSGVGLGRYGAGWYATVGYQLVRAHERTSWGANGLFRWYLQGAETYLDLQSNYGHEVVVVGSGPRTRLLQSTSVGVSLHLPLSGGLSLIPELRYVNQPGLTRWGGSLALGLDL